MVQSISTRFIVLEMMIQVLRFLLCSPLDISAAQPQKWGSCGLAIVYALHEWLISIFLKIAETNNLQIYTGIVLEDLYISPEMMSPATSVRRQNHIRPVHFSCLDRDFLITVQPILKKVYGLGKL